MLPLSCLPRKRAGEKIKGTGQIAVKIHPKKRTVTAEAIDFPLIFAFGAPSQKSGWQSVFGRGLFERTCFPEIVVRPY
jgi:hypothetical protein